jgi:hypothetical protein
VPQGTRDGHLPSLPKLPHRATVETCATTFRRLAGLDDSGKRRETNVKKRSAPVARLDDPSLYSVSALVVALTLIGAGLVTTIAASAHPHSLFISMAPPSTISAMYGSFIVIPAILGFLGIGGPALVRSLRAIFARQLVGRRAAAIVAATIAMPCVLLPGWLGPIALVIALLAAARGAQSDGLAAPSRALFWTALGQSAGLIALVRFGLIVAEGGDPGFALAPTATLAAGFFGWTSLWVTAAGLAAVRTTQAAIAFGLAAVAASSWPIATQIDAGATAELASFALSAMASVALAIFAYRCMRDARAL